MCYKKVFSTFPLLVLASFLLTSISQAQISEAEKIYEQGIYQLEATGNFEEAIRLFERIVKEFPKDKEVAAKALLNLGLCYERIGNRKAEEVYNRLIENYPDQAPQVAEARQRLSSLLKESEGNDKTVTLTYGEGYFESLSLSPDGTQMAGLDFIVGQNIALHDFRTKETNLVTDFSWDDDIWAYYPIWSADGEELAYITGGFKENAPQSLWISNLDGKSQLIYTGKSGQTIRAYDWFHHGKAVLVILRDSTENVLGIIPRSGGKIDILKKFNPGEVYSARISPDDRFVAFSEGERGARDIRIISTDKKQTNLLTDNPSDDTAPLWSPDGKHLIFQSKRHGDWAIWGVEIKDGLPTKIPFIIMAGTDDVRFLNWSPAGLAIQRSIWTNDIYRMPVDPSSGRATGKPKQINYTPTGSNNFPAWSPDGKYLAFFSMPRTGQGFASVVIIPTNNDASREFHVPWKFVRGPIRWTTDSKALGFTSVDADHNTNLYRLTLETEKWEMWSLDVDTWTTIDWGKNDNSYFYAAQGFGSGDNGIVSSTIGENGSELIYTPKEPEGNVYRNLRCSRNHKYLAFQEDNRRVIIVNEETGESRAIKPKVDSSTVFIPKEAYGFPIWSPDSKRLLLTKIFTEENLSNQTQEFYIFDLEDETFDKIDIDMTVPEDGSINMSDWSPDGKEIAFTVRVTFDEDQLIKSVIPEEHKK
jgi:Tol biopolymer transport system component